MHLTTWPCPLPDGRTSEELVVQFDQARANRLLVIPALFDEANKLRRMTVEVMHRLDLSGIDSFLPDLPGANESAAPLPKQSLESWRKAAASAEQHFDATHVLSLRGGVLVAPAHMHGWQYAPQSGAKTLRGMLRARTIAAREAGREETIEALESEGRDEGIELAGWQLGPELFTQLETADVPKSANQAEIAQSEIGGAGLWLRAEPDEDPEQADALAAIIAVALVGEEKPE